MLQLTVSQSRFEVRGYFTTDGRSVSQYVLVSSTLVGLVTRYYFLSECCCLKFVVLFLWGALCREDGSAICSVITQNPQPYFTVSSETPPTWRARFPYLCSPGTRWTSYTPSTGFPLRRLLRLARLRRRYSNPPRIYILQE
jgi:hypothetical protein